MMFNHSFNKKSQPFVCKILVHDHQRLEQQLWVILRFVVEDFQDLRRQESECNLTDFLDQALPTIYIKI